MDEARLATMIDTSRPNVACMYDYFLGGKYNSAADRAAGDKAIKAIPLIPMMAKMNRDFLGRAVRFMARQGVKQFLDIGSGLPSVGSTHRVAQDILGEGVAKVVYVDHEEAVKILGDEILAGDENTVVIKETCLNAKTILEHQDVKRLIDFSQPVGVIMVALLHFFSDEEIPDIIDPVRDAVCLGSFFVASQLLKADDSDEQFGKGAADNVKELYRAAMAKVIDRSREQIERVTFSKEGWELQRSGLANVGTWGLEDEDRTEGDFNDCWLLGGVLKKVGTSMFDIPTNVPRSLNVQEDSSGRHDADDDDRGKGAN